MVAVIEDIEEIIRIKPELQKVYDSDEKWNLHSPSMIIEAVKNFCSAQEKKSLFFVLNRNGNQIESYLPLYIDDSKTLRFIFDIHTDFCGAIGKSLEYQFFKDFTKLVLANKNIRKINLDNLLPDSELLNSLQHFLKPGVFSSCYNNHSFIYASDNKGFFDHLKSKDKSELKRIQNKNKAYSFEIFSANKPFPEEKIIELRDKMISSKLRTSDFFGSSFLKLCRSLYESGELEIFCKSDENSHLVSGSLVLKKQKAGLRMVWIDLYTDIQYINLSSYIEYINYLEQFKPITFDFGRGSYDYKSKNFQPQMQNLYCLRYSKSKFDFYYTNYFPVKEFVKRIVKG